MRLPQQLDAQVRLPPKPKGLKDILDHVVVTIDPHRSLHAMVQVIRGFGSIIDRIGIGALHNRTSIPFLTSDNPVIWFDPSLAEDEIKPYGVHPDGPIVLISPVTPEVAIHGHTSMREGFCETGFGYGDVEKAAMIEMMNRQICRFVYEAAFSRSAGQEEFVGEFNAVSPVARTESIATALGTFQFHEMVFGTRSRRPKWKI